MNTKRIPSRIFGKSNSNLAAQVPIIGIGCSSFANNFVASECDVVSALSVNQETAHSLPKDHKTVKEWIKTLQKAIDLGFNLLDTAPWYGHGSSEVLIGFALKDTNVDRQRLIINTKIGRYDAEPLKQFDFSYDMTIKSVKRSLDRMGCGYIDVLQLHDPEFSPSVDLLMKETIPAMLECQKRGWAKALGLTGYPLELHYEILECARKEFPHVNDGQVFDQVLTYCHFNLHNQNLCTLPMKDGEKTKSLMEYCKSKSIPLMAAAPLSMGLLTHNTPPFWHPASVELKQACRIVGEIAADNGVNLPMLATLFALAHDDISCTLIGMGCERDVENAMTAVERFSKIQETESSISKVQSINDGGKALRKEIQMKLRPVLTDAENKVLEIILNEENGPFAQIWKSNGQSWDGMREADKFWDQVQGGKEAADKNMRQRSLSKH